MTLLDPATDHEDQRWYGRFVLAAVVLSVGSGLAVVLPSEAAPADPGPSDGCVVEATARAAAFAAVLGDTRPIPPAFAERACAAP